MLTHTRRAILLVLLAAGAALGQSDRDQRWRQDIDELVRTVTTRHPNIYANVAKEQFQQETANLLASVPDSSDAEIVIGMQRLLALMRDGHTSMNVFQPASRARRLPLRLYWFADGVFVTDAAANYIKALGKKVLRIEDTPVEDAVSRVEPLISHENEWWVKSQAPALLTSPDVLSSAGIAPKNATRIRYTLEGADGQGFTVDVEPIGASLISLPQKARPNPPLYRRYGERYYWIDLADPGKVLYMKYNMCAESPVLTMNDMVTAMFGIYQSNAVDRFVIDLRNNPGGNAEVIRPLVEGIAAAKAAGVVTPDRLYAIIGRDTFSSGLSAAIDFKRLGATLAGEPTGNSPSHFGQVYNFALTNSRLAVSVSTRYWEFRDFPGDALLPDIRVELTSSDYFDERDPVLEAIMGK